MAKRKDRTTEKGESAPKRRSKRAAGGVSAKTGFYAQALTEAETVLLAQAREIEGLDEEIALLRVRLSSLLAEHPEDTELMLKGVGMLVKAVGTRYRLSKKAENDLYQSVLGVLQGIGGAIFPEGFSQPE